MKGCMPRCWATTPCADDEFEVNYLEKVYVGGTRNFSNFYAKTLPHDFDSKDYQTNCKN